MNNFDKFYTKQEIAKQCYFFLLKKYPQIENKLFLEPSAGGGVFLPYLKNYIALDIAPESTNIIQADFLTFQPPQHNLITIGNPPFGKRSKLAIDFFNHAAIYSDIIGFIVPVSFMKWNVQKQLNENFALIAWEYLPENSFTDNNKDYKIRTVFQIWINKNSSFYENQDYRLITPPATTHSDFNLWQYNATPQSIKVIDEDWTIAIYRQGHFNYNTIFTKKDYDFIYNKMTGEKKQQFFFIKPLTEEAKAIIAKMNFNDLAARNTLMPGFGKGDFISYYEEIKKYNLLITKK